MSTVNWYSHRRWREKVRPAQLQREPLCRYCKARGKTEPATIADHIEPHRNDKHKFWHGELQSLCKQCHDSIKQSLEKGGSGSMGADTNGFPIEPYHHWNT